MTFGKSISKCFRNYAVFTGRASRSEYWWFALFNFIIGLLIAAIFVAVLYFTLRSRLNASPMGAVISSDSILSDEELETWATTLTAIYGLYGLLVFLPSLGVTIRRLHDSGRSGWNYLWVLFPFIGSIILLIFLLMPSMPAANKYGDEPAN